MQRPNQPRKDILSFDLSDCVSLATNSIQFSLCTLNKMQKLALCLKKEAGFVRTFRIQSAHSEDFQVSRAPKNPSILINLE